MDASAAAAAAAAASSIRRRNGGTALALLGFCAVVYVWTTDRMRSTDVLADMGDELDQVRQLRAEKKAAASKPA